MRSFEIIAESVVCFVDHFSAATGFKLDRDADLIDGFAFEFESDDLSMTGIAAFEVGDSSVSDLFKCRFRAHSVDHLIFNGRIPVILDVEVIILVLEVQGENIHAVLVITLQETFVGTALPVKSTMLKKYLP